MLGGCLILSPATVGVGEACRRASHGTGAGDGGDGGRWERELGRVGRRLGRYLVYLYLFFLFCFLSFLFAFVLMFYPFLQIMIGVPKLELHPMWVIQQV